RELGWYHPFEIMLLGCCLLGAGWYTSRRNPEWDVLPHLRRPTWTQAILGVAVCCLIPQVPFYALCGVLWAAYQGARVTLCPPWAAVRTVTRVPAYISASIDR